MHALNLETVKIAANPCLLYRCGTQSLFKLLVDSLRNKLNLLVQPDCYPVDMLIYT